MRKRTNAISSPLFVLAVASVAWMASCNVEMPYIPPPWTPTETQLAEPVSPSEAAIPAWGSAGLSIRGKELQALTMGSGTRRIYIIGGFYGDEIEGPAVTSQLPAVLLAELVGDGGKRATVRIVRDMNPDGTATRTRGNTRGTDLNRNWPSRDYQPRGLDTPGRRHGPRAKSELETVAILADMTAFKPDLVIVFRTAITGRGPMVGSEGGKKAAHAQARAFAFAAAARDVDPRWRLNPGTAHVGPGSVESLFGRDRGIPVLTVEFQRGQDTRTNVNAVRAGIVALLDVLKPATTAAVPAAMTR